MELIAPVYIVQWIRRDDTVPDGLVQRTIQDSLVVQGTSIADETVLLFLAHSVPGGSKEMEEPFAGIFIQFIHSQVQETLFP